MNENKAPCVLVSGGVDSSLVAYFAQMVSPDAVSAIAVSESLYPESLNVARLVSAYIGIPLVEVPTHEVDDPEYQANGPDRCKICRKISVAAIKTVFPDHQLLSGVNASDVGDLPGINEMTKNGVRHPFKEAGIPKPAIRAMAKAAGLPNWGRPAMACLSSSVPRGIILDSDMLHRLGNGLRIVHESIPGSKNYITRVREQGPGHAVVVFEQAMLDRLTPSEKDRVENALTDYNRVDFGLYVHGQMNS